MIPRLDWPSVLGRRLQRHHLARPAPGRDLAVVAADICGAHAQMAPSVELMLALRTRDATRADVRRAMWDRLRPGQAPSRP